MGIAIFEKRKKIRLKGKALADLNAECHARDKGCIICHCWVDPGEKMHHFPGGKDKEDIISKVVILCYQHHQEAHGGKNAKEIQDKCKKYLGDLYD